MITSSTAGYYRITSTDNTANTDVNTSGSRGFAFYDPQPVEVQISPPKKQRVLHLERAKLKEQRKVWGLRKR